MDAFRWRLELRKSNAAQRHRNRYRERQSGKTGWRDDHLADLESNIESWEPGELDA